MPVKEKIRNKRNASPVFDEMLRGSVWLLLTFFTSFSSIVGGACPFAISLITVSNKKALPFSMVGAGIGYLIFCQGSQSVRYFTAVLIASIATLAVDLLSKKRYAYLPMLVSFLSVLSTGAVMNYREGAGAAEYALTLGEAVLALGCSLFFFRCVHVNYRRLKYKALPIADIVCLLISASVLLSGFSFIQIKGVSLARIVAVLLITVTVRFGEQKWGLILSLCLGFALGISQRDSLFLIGAYAFSALVASLFSGLSSLGVAGSYCLSMIFFTACASMGSFSVCCAVESAVAGLILVVLPEVLTDKISEFFESGADIAPDGSLRQSLIVRLRFAASALSQVSESVRDVRERMNTLDMKNPLEGEMRMVAADQFFSIADMLDDLAFEFNDAEIFDFKAAARIRRMLGEYEIYPENISVIVDKFDRMRVEILAPSKTKGLESPRIKNEICRICSRDFEQGRINLSGSKMMLSIVEKANFSVSFGFAQYSAEGTLCGDTVKVVNDLKGHMVFIISDGMGTGSRAALDGAMGAGLLSKLLGAGFGFDSSLKVVNSALLVKSGEESLATLDCARIDLFTGKCEFYKAGAPVSYIVKKSSITRCELSSMPAGILRGIEFAKRTTVLNVGDEVIMMSDGITDTDSDKLEEFLSIDEGLPPSEKAQSILDFAIECCGDGRRDDMSVIVARLTNRQR